MLPFPSSHFLRRDASTRTGYRVAFPRRAMLHTKGGGRVSPAPLNRLDGFSPLSPLLFHLPGVAALGGGLAPWNGARATLNASATTLHWQLIDSEAGTVLDETSLAAPAAARRAPTLVEAA